MKTGSAPVGDFRSQEHTGRARLRRLRAGAAAAHLQGSYIEAQLRCGGYWRKSRCGGHVDAVVENASIPVRAALHLHNSRSQRQWSRF